MEGGREGEGGGRGGGKEGGRSLVIKQPFYYTLAMVQHIKGERVFT